MSFLQIAFQFWSPSRHAGHTARTRPGVARNGEACFADKPANAQGLAPEVKKAMGIQPRILPPLPGEGGPPSSQPPEDKQGAPAADEKMQKPPETKADQGAARGPSPDSPADGC